MKKSVSILLISLISPLFSFAQENPFNGLGYDVLVATSSKGDYAEFHNNKDIVEIGSVYFNTKTNQVVGFIDENTEASKEVISSTNAMSIDPHCEKYYWISPYAYAMNNPVNMIDPDGRDAVFIAFPDYKISTPIGQLSNLGHAGVLLIDNKTGLTKYYEYGRYDKDGKGEVRTRTISDVKIGNDGKPTAESLNKVLGEISDKAGQGGKIEGAYVESDMFKEMNDYAKSKKADNNNPDRKKYSLTSNNCGTFAADVIKQDPEAKKDAPTIIDPRPNSMVKEYQKEFTPIIYDPEKDKQKK